MKPDRDVPRMRILLLLLLLTAVAALAVAVRHRRVQVAAVPVVSAGPTASKLEIEAAAHARAALREELKHPASGEAGMLRLSYLYSQSREFLPAVRELELAIRKYPHSDRPLVALGQLLRAAHFADRAMEAFRLARVVDPKDWHPYVELSTMETDLGWQNESVQDAEKAAALAPDEPATAIALSMAYFQAALWTRAEEAIKKAIAISPRDAKLWVLLGQVQSYYGMIQYSQASEAFQKALALGGPTPDLYGMLGDLELKWVRPQHLERAQEYYKKELEIRPASPGAIVNLADVAAQSDHIKEAVHLMEMLKPYPRLQPPGYKLKLGQYYIRDGKLAQGQAMIQEFGKSSGPKDERASIRVAMVPSDASAHYRQGIDHFKHRFIDYAVVELREAARLAPKNKTFRDALVYALVSQDRLPDAARIQHGKPLVSVTELVKLD